MTGIRVPMDYFRYEDNKLFAERVPVEQIAAQVGTPVYVYSKATFLEHLHRIRKAYEQLDTMVCYSVKACGNINILRFLAQAHSGFDIVSGGELYRAVTAGADPGKIVFAGVGKTDTEITEALNTEIAYYNIESEAELENLIRIAAKLGKKTKAALRVNPDVDYKTHRYIATGKKEAKFGVDIERAQNVFAQYGANDNVNLCALHVHLGSGGRTIDPYVEAVKRVLPLIDTLRRRGHTIEALNLGGGYGADYESDSVPSAADYAQGIVPLLKDMNLKLILEPGKSISANAGILLCRVLYMKQGGDKKFVIVDAAMNDLIRPCLYDAFHFIWPAHVDKQFLPQKRSKDLKVDGTEQVDIVGPICEGADFLAKDRNIPPVKQQDLIAVFTAGAYGFTMSSNYNARCRAAEVLIDGDRFSVIRRRETYEDLTALEK